jgi:acetyl esterase
MDPQAAAYLARTASLGVPPVNELPPAEGRHFQEEGTAALWGPLEEVASVRDLEVGGVPVRLYDPDPAGALPMTVYFHGGGWVVGSRNTVDGPCRALANRARCRVASVDYRLAPEHRFPAAVEDSWAVTRWAFEQAPRVAAAGDSAGGNLAAVVALKARDAGLPLAFQWLVYPVLDHDFSSASYTRNAEGNGLTRAGMRWFWDHYLGGQDGGHPDASPIRAASLAGVAPALVSVCECDVLHDEGVEYHRRLEAAGVPSRLSDYEGMIHGFIRLAAVIDRTQHLLDEGAAALRDAFAR